ncbi:MAG: DUF4301 family protein [Acidobacteriota bacterium]|nr:DUF4301 family protein [Acidobacteriota bacterium]
MADRDNRVGSLADADLEQLRARGISPAEAERQMRRIAAPPGYTTLDRPCTRGDGIDTIDAGDVERLGELSDETARDGRLLKFVPASGAASRMFKSLAAFHERGDLLEPADVEREVVSGNPDAAALAEFIRGIPRFAFRDELARVVAGQGGDLDALAAGGPYGPVLDGLLARDGMDYARLPKGLILFHGYSDAPRTAFEEHLVEAAALVRGRDSRTPVHFTVSPAHLDAFRELFERVRTRYESELGVTYDLQFSFQKPATDTLALGTDDQPFRLNDGSLLFRPAGHGALIENLGDLDADVLLIKNIDNVAPDARKGPGTMWSKALTGRLVEIRDAVFDLLGRIEHDRDDTTAIEEATAFARDTLHHDVVDGASRDAIVKTLDRPIRVCGMVPNTGEPGGGPFWARSSDGNVGLQIVEMAQIDPGDPDQRAIVARATHFNPVFMVCGLRNHRGEAFDLHRFIDPETEIVSRKSYEGRDLKALERPGLWNGAMGYWNTVFVEVPVEVFNPVKTINDLLRPSHQ